jgi:hypothetical protein
MLKSLKTTYPKSWNEFVIIASSILKANEATAALNVEDLPFELAFGILLKFFKENELEFDYNNLEPKQYETEIKNIFANFETVIGHFS